MKNLYEQNWKNALGGAKVKPSEALWDAIATNLDKEQGRNYWVTLLMIAATITIAFSFPLTIGNSAFEVRPDSFQYMTSQLSNNNDINIVANNIDSCAIENNFFDYIEGDRNEFASTKLKSLTSKVLFIKKSKILASSNVKFDMPTTLVQGVTFTELDFDIELKHADIRNHYIIPIFMPIDKHTIDRGLLASLNMGTGSSTTNSNGRMFETLSASANSLDYAEVSKNTSLENPVENASYTFYIGAGVELPIGKRWSLLPSLGYLAQNTNGVSNVVLDNGEQKIPMGAYDPILPGVVFLSETYNYSATNSYISLPLSFKYSIINRKVKFRAGTGISSDFMLSRSINSETYGKVDYKPESQNYKAVMLSGLINLDVSYNLNNQYSVAFETGFRRGLSSIDYSQKSMQSSFTVGVALFYKIQ